MDNLTELEQLNLKVAAIAGWTDIEVWQPDLNLPIKTFQGENKAHPELGKFVPKYVENIDAIAPVIGRLGYEWSITSDGDAFITCGLELVAEICEKTPAIALCKLLIELNPKPEIVEATFG